MRATFSGTGFRGRRTQSHNAQAQDLLGPPLGSALLARASNHTDALGVRLPLAPTLTEQPPEPVLVGDLRAVCTLAFTIPQALCIYQEVALTTSDLLATYSMPLCSPPTLVVLAETGSRRCLSALGRAFLPRLVRSSALAVCRIKPFESAIAMRHLLK